ncbi:GNAT family N-acetyltransferase [Sphingorhabdus lacus]|jgi:GNAT superfamily N-acetyltransferase|uniref:GNAT family N-acetyltransferase n=1 Tax=Sphingorhabdus lacus TaxID=392610 RepID=A0A6I6L7L4_9SPHN|nr:GNAT family N-acetyltransferase [Sphingorhabdus lacus]QGY80448.1 GNAT family N-acetyltransferase [Sphingorhabdus lacus]
MPFTPIAKGEIGAIVTSLEMRNKPSLRALPATDLRLERWPNPTADKYRTLYRRIGEPWLWFSRLTLDDAELCRIIHDPKVRIWAVIDQRGVELGIVELDFRESGQCEIAFFGLVPELTGKGHGKWLMAMALQFGWSEPGVERIWVHTCTLDAPGALNFYINSGFTPYQRQVETFVDPRLIGLIPSDAAPQIPVIP